MAQHVKILERVDAEPVEVPLERDGTLLLSTLVGQYPDTVGIRFKSDTGSWRGVRCEGNIIHPPPNGWGNTDYYIVCDDGHGDGCVRDVNGEKQSKHRKLRDGDLIAYSLQKQLGELERAIQMKPVLCSNMMRPEINRGNNKSRPGPYWATGNFPRNFPSAGDDGKITFTAGDGKEWKLWPKQIEVMKKRRMLEEEAQVYMARGETPPGQQVPESECEPLLTGRQGFHILCRQGLCRLLGRDKIATEAIEVFRKYLSLVSPGAEQTTYFERKFDGKEDGTYVFIETDMKDPAKLSDVIYRDLYSQNCVQNIEAYKCWIKFIPVHRTCTADVVDIRKNLIDVIEPIFQEHARFGTYPQFRLHVNGNHRLYTDMKFRLLGDYLASKGYNNGECWKDDSENCIFLRFKENMGYISYLRNYNKYARYTVVEMIRNVVNK